MAGFQMAPETNHNLPALSVGVSSFVSTAHQLILLPAVMYDFAMVQDGECVSWPDDRKERAMAM